MRFDDIIGQKDIKDHLQAAITDGKVSHAYIISGERGMGKKMLAEAFVQTLFCEKHGADACEECPECRKVMHKNHPDVIYVHPEEGKKTIGVNDVRDQLVGDVYIRPYSADIKVYIIPDADQLGAASQNAILKTIEEPPEYVRLLLLAENAERLLPTIRSRCIELDLKPVVGEDDKVRKLLMEKYELPEYVTGSILQFAQGNIGRALSLASSDRFKTVLDQVFYMVSHIDEMQNYEISAESEKLKAMAKDGQLDLKEYLDLLLLWYRDVLLYKTTADADRLYFTDRLREIMRLSSLYSYRDLDVIIEKISSTEALLKANIGSELALSLLMQCIRAGGK